VVALSAGGKRSFGTPLRVLVTMYRFAPTFSVPMMGTPTGGKATPVSSQHSWLHVLTVLVRRDLWVLL
jgi:hypothetical protein